MRTTNATYGENFSDLLLSVDRLLLVSTYLSMLRDWERIGRKRILYTTLRCKRNRFS